MTKRIVSTIVFAGLLFGSVDAFASRARTIVMGQGDAGSMLSSSQGSFYYDEMYNVFYNPAYVNDFKNWAIIEKGNNTVGGQTNMGGFVANFMNFNVGLFFNRADAFAASGNNLANNTPALGGTVNGALPLGNTRPIDLMVGGDMGVKWGIGATYANANGGTAAGVKESNLTLRAGVSIADFDPFVSYRLISKTEATAAGVTTENEVSDATVGLRYHYGEWTPYAAYRFGDIESSGVATSNGERVSNTSYLVGVGRNLKLGEGARMVYSIAYARISYDDYKAAGSNTVAGDATRSVLPIDFALEGDLSSWITLRAGLGYRLIDRLSGTQASTDNTGAGVFGTTFAGSVADNTSARVGATIHANKFDFDWAFGRGAVANDTAVNTENFGFGESLFSYASLSYKW